MSVLSLIVGIIIGFITFGAWCCLVVSSRCEKEIENKIIR